MSAYFDNMGLDGFAHWIERDGRVILQEIPAPPKNWENPEDAIAYAYEHEKEVTNKINNLINLAKKLQDYAAENFLQWFIEV